MGEKFQAAGAGVRVQYTGSTYGGRALWRGDGPDGGVMSGCSESFGVGTEPGCSGADWRTNGPSC